MTQYYRRAPKENNNALKHDIRIKIEQIANNSRTATIVDLLELSIKKETRIKPRPKFNLIQC